MGAVSHFDPKHFLVNAFFLGAECFLPQLILLGLLFSQPCDVMGEGGLEYWLPLSLVGDIGEDGVEQCRFISLVRDIGKSGLEHWLSVSLVGDLGEGGLEQWLSVSLVGDICEGGMEH
ncbi:hypothetical protein PoB_002580000 [Plakobranchus ocellatus]|uniref:Uncharacterized protein n=1 Tax=Plakobranchus ocellatus TaxID=259542 RepID=A0AAV3ZXC5_9GAST|nr:hypothetical protein PoB_002580000 [Plakobranchus ocellatus]